MLTEIETTPFFTLMRTHTIQGTFCDPAYGGNAGFVGWDLIRYPGLRLAVTADDQRMALPPKPSAPVGVRLRDVREARWERPMPTSLKPTDVVIVGMGAAGGVAVLPLAQAGLEVVGLEAGTWLTPKDFAPDELRNNYRAWPQSVQKANREVPTHRPNASAPYSPRAPFHPMMNGVGGTSLHYWAQSWRLNPWDFRVVSDTTSRYGAARIPAGSTVEDWPFGIDELERYYDVVERELGVSGKAGNLSGKIDARGNVFEAPRRREYPMPPLRWTDWHEKMAAAARGLGWHPFPGPAAVNTRTYEGRPGCAYHGFCHVAGVM